MHGSWAATTGQAPFRSQEQWWASWAGSALGRRPKNPNRPRESLPAQDGPSLCGDQPSGAVDSTVGTERSTGHVTVLSHR